MTRDAKPLGQKAYGSIAHLPSSRLGEGDHHCHEGQARIATEKARDRHDLITVQEKLDGGCVAIARVGDDILALGRAGYLASTSPFEQHHVFSDWVAPQGDRFRAFLDDGDRVVGEWLAQACGTRYALPHEPFVAFDIMRGGMRATAAEVRERCGPVEIITPRIISEGVPLSLHLARGMLDPSGHGALEPVEGAVWRVERKGVVDFLVKWVRPDKVDGCYLPEISGAPAIWNWHPEFAA